MAREKVEKPKYTSPYKTEMIAVNGNNLLIQYRSDDLREEELNRRTVLFNHRIERNRDFKMTPFFEKRSVNILQKLFDSKTAEEMLDIAVRASSISVSVYFRYQDFKDILNDKVKQFEFDQDQKEILDFIQESLDRNDVIAPKIVAIYNILFKKKEDGSVDV